MQQTLPETLETPSAALRDSGRGLLRLLLSVLVIVGLAYATTFLILVLVPDANDYADATVLKQQRLSGTRSPKIVLVGGSNLAFGIDSAALEKETACPVVNMGMNGYLGLRYMLSEIKANLHASDVVVLSLEYNNFFKSVDGTPSALLGIAKANPAALSFLSWKQIFELVPQVPNAAQQKIFRLMNEGIRGAKHRLAGSTPGVNPNTLDMNTVEILSGFTARGDLTSHLGLRAPWPLGDGPDATHLPVDQPTMAMIEDFAHEMNGKSVTLVLSYTAVADYYAERHAYALRQLHDRLSAIRHLAVPRAPAGYKFEPSYFFDNIYHLNELGRPLRTSILAADLNGVLGAKSPCRRSQTGHLERPAQ